MEKERGREKSLRERADTPPKYFLHNFYDMMMGMGLR